MVGARDVRYDALSALPLRRRPHPHVPIPEYIGSRPFGFKFSFVQFATQYPVRKLKSLKIDKRNPNSFS